MNDRVTYILITGGRDFTDYSALKEACDKYSTNETIIVAGGARGADALAKQYAKEHNLGYIEFPAKWDDLTATPCTIAINGFGKEYNMLAGFNRNGEMVQFLNSNKETGICYTIAFWDGVSKGTKDCMDKSAAIGIKPIVVRYREHQTRHHVSAITHGLDSLK